jgi:hypothetical protein
LFGAVHGDLAGPSAGASGGEKSGARGVHRRKQEDGTAQEIDTARSWARTGIKAVHPFDLN